MSPFRQLAPGSYRRLRAEFGRRFPDVQVEPKRVDWGQEVEALREEAADVAFLWLPADTEGLHVEVVATEARYAAVDLGHPLAERDSLQINELNEFPIMWTEQAPREFVDWWVGAGGGGADGAAD